MRSLTPSSSDDHAPTIIAASPATKAILARVEGIKDTDLTILITGEVGTGKDLLAEHIHRTSNRQNSRFVQIYATALPDQVLEAELFGWRNGSFTGATEDKPGLIEAANGGTCFYSEIGEAPLSIQAKLLHVLESKTVRRIGSTDDIPLDVRFLAATSCNLEAMVEAKTFRHDLYHHLSSLIVHLPPLRERREDLPPLLSHFASQEGVELPGNACAQLLGKMNSYAWPGNVRQLRSLIIEAATISGRGDFAPRLSDALEELTKPLSSLPPRILMLLRVLERHHGNLLSAARELGIPVRTLLAQLRRYQLL